jgi:BlaR1 peptidase M56
LIHSLRLRRLWRSATPVDLPAMCIPSGRHFDVCTTSSISRPSVIGFFAPRILIPDWLFARLTPAELEHIVLHESEHLRRRDDWTNLLQKLALVVFPLSPALWFIDSRLSKQREMACDEGVVRITNAPRAYAACLASLAERGLAYRTEALSLGAWHHRSELVHRVHGILRNQRAMHPIAARALLATLGSGLLVASVSLARCPQLVAFVQTASAGPAVAHANTEPAALADAAYSSSRANTMPQFHAVEAVAKFPVEHAAPTVNRTPHSSTSSTPSRNQALQISALHSPAPAAAPAQPAEQWIVYTEFEQVETLNPANQNIADYDTTQSTSAAPMNQAPASPGDPTAKTQPASRITVTRLILKFTPSNSAQPAAIPIGNGWFVIQL